MKYLMSLLLVAGIAALVVGCQDKKDASASANPSVTDLSAAPATPTYAPAPAPAYSPEPATPVMASGTPDSASMSPAMSANGAGGNYTIKKGDNLWKIASSHYGDGRQYKKIMAANPGLDPAKLKVGQTIVLP